MTSTGGLCKVRNAFTACVLRQKIREKNRLYHEFTSDINRYHQSVCILLSVLHHRRSCGDVNDICSGLPRLSDIAQQRSAVFACDPTGVVGRVGRCRDPADCCCSCTREAAPSIPTLVPRPQAPAMDSCRDHSPSRFCYGIGKHSGFMSTHVWVELNPKKTGFCLHWCDALMTFSALQLPHKQMRQMRQADTQRRGVRLKNWLSWVFLTHPIQGQGPPCRHPAWCRRAMLAHKFTQRTWSHMMLLICSWKVSNLRPGSNARCQDVNALL